MHWARLVGVAAVTLALAGCKPSIREGYPSTSWGMTLEQVKTLYPVGLTEVAGTGETFFRTKTKPFGSQIALTTFTFLPKHGLNAMLFEFPDSGVKVEPPWHDYQRPSAEQVEGIKASISKAFDAKYGKANYTADGIGGFRLGWGEHRRLSESRLPGRRLQSRRCPRMDLE